MKQALSPETPARVRRSQLRAITLGAGVSALAMACSFGQIDDKGTGINPVDAPAAGSTATTATAPTGDGVNASDPTGTNAAAAGPSAVAPGTTSAATTGAYAPDQDPFQTPIGQQVKAMLTTDCAGCHEAPNKNGDMDFILDLNQLIANQKIIPGDKEDSRIYIRLNQGSMPPAFMRDNRPTYGDIDLVGQFIDGLPPIASEQCVPGDFVDNDTLIREMNQDIQTLDSTDQPFTRYLTVAYDSNGGGCGRELDRQRYALFKMINSVSTNTVITQPLAIDKAQLVYRIDIRDYNWDRPIDLQDDGVVDFNDAWDAIAGTVGDYAVEYTGTDADALKAASGNAIPFLPVNAVLQEAEHNDLYYALIGGKASLFDFEKDVLKIDTAADLAENDVMRAGFTNSGVSKQDRTLNRFDSGLAVGQNYWLSFDFNGGAGGGDAAAEGDRHDANESIFSNPLGFQFAGGEAIFSLPNGLQGYYVAKFDGTRLNDAPIGVVVDPSQNGGNVVNGASCNSCHNAGMISFTDQVRQYVVDNAVDFDKQTYEDVMADYPDMVTFQAVMDSDSKMHTDGLVKAGLPAGTPDPVSRVFLDFQLGNTTLQSAAGELGVTQAQLKAALPLLNPELQVLASDGGYVSRTVFTANFKSSVCILQSVNENSPVNCQ